MSVAAQIEKLFAERGDSGYGGESVTQLEHALQCALLAEQAGASPSLVVAALLHDIGHLLHDLPDSAPDEGVDDRHETSGHNYLKKHFSAAVSDPVRMHVAAKRYLCTVDENYYEQLSEPSIVSLELQGGTMSEAERADFESSTHWKEALELRRWDDLAKVVGLDTPALEHYLPMVNTLDVTAGDVT